MRKTFLTVLSISLILAVCAPLRADISSDVSDLFSLNTMVEAAHRHSAVSEFFSLNTMLEEELPFALSELFSLNTAFQPDDRIVLSLDEGWNMISLNVVPPEEYWTRDEGPDVVRLMDRMRDADGSLVVILVKSLTGQFYAPEFEFINIEYWDLEQGYHVKARTDLSGITIYGQPLAADADIHLRPGWNEVAYYPTYQLDASSPVFYVVSPIFDQLLFAKNIRGQFISPEYEFSNMPSWREGQGYQIKASESVILNYPAEQENLLAMAGSHDLPTGASLGPAKSLKKPVQVSAADNHWPEPVQTGVNQSVLINSFQGRSLPDGSQIAAITREGLVVGLGRVESGRCGLAVWGDDVSTEAVDGLAKGEEFELRLWDVKRMREMPLVVAQVLQGAGLVYETDSFTALTLADAQAIPDEYFLAEAYPNPFNSTVRLSYGLPDNAEVTIRVYDAQGRQVASLVDGPQPAGYHVVMWQGDALASGMYFVKMTAGKFQATRKITMVK